MFLPRTMEFAHAFQLRNVLNDYRFEELDLVINSGGGNIHAAYQIIELLRLRAKKISACVPYYAKSGATLVCIGCDEIILDEIAQLGPLDTQIPVARPDGQDEFQSALNLFKALERVQSFAAESLDLALRWIAFRSQAHGIRMSIHETLPHATEFVRVTTGPLVSQLNPEKLGDNGRALAVVEEYGKRLLRRFSSWDPDKSEDVIRRLVHEYPSHDYIIDYRELSEMGFTARLFDSNEHKVVQDLLPYVFGDTEVMLLVHPTRTFVNARTTNQNGAVPRRGGHATRIRSNGPARPS